MARSSKKPARPQLSHGASPIGTGRKARFEALEDRRMLTTTVYLDFGTGIGLGNSYPTTMNALWTINGVGPQDPFFPNSDPTGLASPANQAWGTGPDLTRVNALFTGSTSLGMAPYGFEYDGVAGITSADIDALAAAVIPIVQRTFDAFDVNVVRHDAVYTPPSPGNPGSDYFDNVRAALASNNNESEHADAYIFVLSALTSPVGAWPRGAAAASDTYLYSGNNLDEAAFVFANKIHTDLQPNSPAFTKETYATAIAYVSAHEAGHTFGLHHTVATGPTDILSDGDIQHTAGGANAGSETLRNPATVTRFDLPRDDDNVHQFVLSDFNNYDYFANQSASKIGLRDSDGDGRPDLALVTGTGAYDQIQLTRDATIQTLVHVTVSAYSQIGSGFIATKQYDINLLSDTEGKIVVEAGLANDDIRIDADIPADIVVRGNGGYDVLTLSGRGASALRSFVYEGEGDNDTFVISRQFGDPFPLAGFNFDFIGGPGSDSAIVTEPGGTRKALFVNVFSDAADINVGNQVADSSSAIDDQTTLRAAIQEAAATPLTGLWQRPYIFLPAGTYNLTLGGIDATNVYNAALGDLDVNNKSIVVMGTGAGSTIIDASTLGPPNPSSRERIFDVSPTGSLDLRRATLTGGMTISGGGAIRVADNPNASTDLALSEVALVGNSTPSTGGPNPGGAGLYVGPGANALVTGSVITANSSGPDGGGIYVDGGSVGANVTLDRTIVAKNWAPNSTGKDLKSAGAIPGTFSSLGRNLFTTTAGGTFSVGAPLQASDYVNSNPTHIVTSVVDTLNHTDDLRALSLRDAVDTANVTAGNQILWLPAWTFTLTKVRTTPLNQVENSVAQGDLDISESLTIRGSGDGTPANNATLVRWRAGIPAAEVDVVFDLLGDYDDDGYVDGDDFLLWQQGGAGADGDDDGDVDSADLTLWQQKFGSIFSKTNVG